MSNVIDMAVIEELLSLCEDGDPELLLDLIGIFLDDGPAKVQAVIDGVDSGDIEKVERAAHSLKGSSGNLGATFLQEVCEQLQECGRNKDLNAARTVAPQLESAFAEAQGALDALRSRYSPA